MDDGREVNGVLPGVEVGELTGGVPPNIMGGATGAACLSPFFESFA
jgi:hypothetical protein